MNQRIKELLAKALDADTIIASKTFGHWPLYDEDLEKFAELIVRECADLIDNKVMITAAQTYDEVFVAKFDTKELCAKQIKEHFGVEE